MTANATHETDTTPRARRASTIGAHRIKSQ